MPNILQIAVPNGSAGLLWNGRPAAGISSLLLINQDLNNTVYIGNDPTITATTGARIPIAPNGSLSVDPNSAWYVVGAAAGIEPLVMVPNGQAYFLGITQGLGNLAIPSMQSPNFETGVQGWQISKNGNAEFNNLTIRGTFVGLDFIINNEGAFFYNGTPALGNLKISIVSNGGGTDQFGNVYLDNITAYNVAVAGGGYAQLAANPVTGIPFLVLSPPGLITNTAAPQINSSAVNAGLVNEASQVNVHSGYESGSGSAGDAVLQLISQANDGSFNSIANIIAGQSQATKKDGNAYPIGELVVQATNMPQTINQTSAAVVNGLGPFNVVPGLYKLTAIVQFAGNQAAGTANFQVGSTATTSLPALVGETHDTAVGTTAYTSRGALGPLTSSTLTTNAWTAIFRGRVTFTSTGQISFQAFCSVAADTFKITAAEFVIKPEF